MTLPSPGGPRTSSADAYAKYSNPRSPLVFSPCLLVLRSCLLTSLQLVQIPAANGQAALVLVHALAEVVDVGLAGAALVRVAHLLVLLGEIRVLGRLLGGRGRAAAGEEAAN